MRFADRAEAGRALAEAVTGRVGADAVVLGLPRGGVVVAAPVAAALGAPLDVLAVRKLGLPGRPELAMGALAAVGGVVETVRSPEVLSAAGVDEAAFAAVRERELAELRRRTEAYRTGRAPLPVAGRIVVLVDDGVATGATVRAALAALRARAPARVVLAVPVASPRALAELAPAVDDLVCLTVPRAFRAVGQAYTDFRPTSDDAVRAALAGTGGPPRT
ncbi:phosphoribosyltransferase [Blastococcus sp. TF02A-26]|uniref:phosphoribosyltransferase n=1 Tax=Blastococcus sp. TF02A-26 TaxID=2250577 RepID=UPI000DE8FBF6|nr:phosphoribosyltransferase family protein [Blastococcus sp. TF02A-26]RBY82300.1 phosphoribosyltransferase [Blastococcus sp. TF02A-26]